VIDESQPPVEEVTEADEREARVTDIESSYHEQREALEAKYVEDVKNVHEDYVAKVEELGRMRAEAYSALNASE
jgi:FtsZ-binding cell division protein ZapB